jgi:hypothetical protein
MSALNQLQRGDRLTGPDGTQWRVVDPDDRHDTVWMQAEAGADCWIKHDELRHKLADGTYTHQSEGDQ